MRRKKKEKPQVNELGPREVSSQQQSDDDLVAAACSRSRFSNRERGVRRARDGTTCCELGTLMILLLALDECKVPRPWSTASSSWWWVRSEPTTRSRATEDSGRQGDHHSRFRELLAHVVGTRDSVVVGKHCFGKCLCVRFKQPKSPSSPKRERKEKNVRQLQ